MGKLYQREGKNQKAIATFNRLVKIQRQSYNYYGLVDTYDTLGKIYLKSDRDKQAKQHFQKALELARDLDYKVNYFTSQIKKLDVAFSRDDEQGKQGKQGKNKPCQLIPQ